MVSSVDSVDGCRQHEVKDKKIKVIYEVGIETVIGYY